MLELSSELEDSFWEPESLPPIPERSRLYSLQPVGVGTAQVECLTSYMSRLADAHNLSVGAMFYWGAAATTAAIFEQKLVPYSDGAKRGSHLLSASMYLNGFSVTPQSWVAALERVTQVSNLRELTMIPYQYIFDERGLLRKRRAWCAQCYESDFREGIVFDRLIWCIRIVSQCPIHNTRLVDLCSKCGKSSLYLASKNLPGYCARCGEWLGKPAVEGSAALDKDDFSAYASQATVEILGYRHAELSIPDGAQYSREVFAENLRRCIEHLTVGELSSFAAGAGMRYKTLHNWMTKQALPSIENFLRLTFALGGSASITLISFDISYEENQSVEAST